MADSRKPVAGGRRAWALFARLLAPPREDANYDGFERLHVGSARLALALQLGFVAAAALGAALPGPAAPAFHGALEPTCGGSGGGGCGYDGGFSGHCANGTCVCRRGWTHDTMFVLQEDCGVPVAWLYASAALLMALGLLGLERAVGMEPAPQLKLTRQHAEKRIGALLRLAYLAADLRGPIAAAFHAVYVALGAVLAAGQTQAVWPLAAAATILNATVTFLTNEKLAVFTMNPKQQAVWNDRRARVLGRVIGRAVAVFNLLWPSLVFIASVVVAALDLPVTARNLGATVLGVVAVPHVVALLVSAASARLVERTIRGPGAPDSGSQPVSPGPGRSSRRRSSAEDMTPGAMRRLSADTNKTATTSLEKLAQMVSQQLAVRAAWRAELLLAAAYATCPTAALALYSLRVPASWALWTVFLVVQWDATAALTVTRPGFVGLWQLLALAAAGLRRRRPSDAGPGRPAPLLRQTAITSPRPPPPPSPPSAEEPFMPPPPGLDGIPEGPETDAPSVSVEDMEAMAQAAGPAADANPGSHSYDTWASGGSSRDLSSPPGSEQQPPPSSPASPEPRPLALLVKPSRHRRHPSTVPDVSPLRLSGSGSWRSSGSSPGEPAKSASAAAASVKSGGGDGSHASSAARVAGRFWEF